MTTRRFVLLFSVLLLSGAFALATSNYEYGADEYVTVASGVSPDGNFAITAHGTGYLGYDKFHLYLNDAIAGKTIAPLKEIVDTRDTKADAFAAKWSSDSRQVIIIYRVGRSLKAVAYRIDSGRARPTKGPFEILNKDLPNKRSLSASDKELLKYWQTETSKTPSPRVFGTPLKDDQ